MFSLFLSANEEYFPVAGEQVTIYITEIDWEQANVSFSMRKRGQGEGREIDMDPFKRGGEITQTKHTT